MKIEDLKTRYNSVFGGEALWVRSPGRINIIGEHTDYNGGFVLPAAINKAIYIGISKREDEEVHLYAEDFKEKHTVALSALAPSEKSWPNYILGVADQLLKSGYKIGGFNLYIDGDVPLGAGLSSSAAVECATGYALDQLFNLKLTQETIALVAQKAEHTFAGVMCGIMDQFASVFGKQDHVIKLDCRSLDYEYVPLKLDGYKLVLLNTNVKHALSSSAYNTRRSQCEQGVAWITAHHPEVTSLRDATVSMLDKYVKEKDEEVYIKCRFVIDEIERLLVACDHLKKGDLAALGQKMYETHEGLSEAYEVSCKELDFLVAEVRNYPQVLGARMMGGGFGGCTINIVKDEFIDELIEKISVSYEQECGLALSAYIVETADGTGKI
ncbi:putative galactokinase [Pedobacter sp. BAL39]|uniref:galactokinase n=1 Tax=Pedobacter sp. BAL39 TaxID=391596 RepID=UPI0001559F73|nr:galactokinase [Pedobacter sp. BAL39]EDM35328.1 putative galactokinase [Pedobacter sp. BAL39]